MFRSVKIQSQKCLDLHYRTFLIYASVTKDVVAQGHFAFVILIIFVTRILDSEVLHIFRNAFFDALITISSTYYIPFFVVQKSY